MIRPAWAVLLLAGCTPVAPQAPPLVPASDGFRVGTSGLEIGFGRSEPGASRAVARLVGRPADRVRDDGACRSLIWSGVVTMAVRDGAFMGWTTPDGQSAGRPCGATPALAPGRAGV